MTLRMRHLLSAALLALVLPVAAHAQSSDDTSGSDQYTEQGIPGGETPSQPTETTPEPTPAPSPAPSPSGSGTQPAAEAAPADPQAETAALPRTGSDGGLVALTALALLGCGFLLRRVVLDQSG